jgi:hypothetical protein
MGNEKEIEKIITGFNKKRIRYLLIGRQAVMLYGAPLFSFDYDFWIHPEDKKQLFEFLEDELNCEVTGDRDERKPVFSFFTRTGEKLDIFVVLTMKNSENEKISIEETLKNSIKIREPHSHFFIIVPGIDDLIKLKKIKTRPKDLEDIEYLKSIKKLKI